MKDQVPWSQLPWWEKAFIVIVTPPLLYACYLVYFHGIYP